MKALTLTQPWATLVALGAKKIETRSWRLAGGYLLEEIAIHAGTGLVPVGGHRGLQRLVTSTPFWEVLESAGYNPMRVPACGLPLGVVVAVAFVAGVHDTTSLVEDGSVSHLICGKWERWVLDEREKAFGDYSPGRYGWPLLDVQPLREPVRCRGYQKLWTLPPDVEAAVRAQL